LGAFLVLSRSSPIAVVVLALCSAIVFIVEKRFTTLSFEFSKSLVSRQRVANYFEQFATSARYAKETHVYNLGNYFSSRYRTAFAELSVLQNRFAKRKALTVTSAATLSNIGIYGVMAMFVLQASSGRISLGQMTLCMLSVRQAQLAFGNVLTTISSVIEDYLYIRNFHMFMKLPERASRSKSSPKPALRYDGIIFRDVCFRHEGANHDILTNLSFQVRCGQSLAIMGPNGAGKTTITKLAARLYRPSAGEIRLSGVPLDDWGDEDFAAAISVYFQDFAKYSLSVRENVALANIESLSNDDAILHALRASGAFRFYPKLHNGLETKLGKVFEGGEELSGGEWQQIGLARALIKPQPHLIILDEPTSALTAAAEVSFLNCLKSYTQTAVIVVTHKHTVAQSMDCILYLGSAKCVELGTHDALVAAGGEYGTAFRKYAHAQNCS